MANTGEGSADILDAGGNIVGEANYSIETEAPRPTLSERFSGFINYLARENKYAKLLPALVLAGCAITAPRTPDPTAVPPTPSPIVSESPFSTPTLLPTNTPIPVTPSPTAEVTPSPEPTPTDPILQKWLDMEVTVGWVDANGKLELFGAIPNIRPEDQTQRGVQTDIVDIQKSGNDTVVFMGVQDAAANRLIFPVMLSGEHITSLGLNPSNLAGSGAPRSDYISGDRIYGVMTNYLGDISNFVLRLDESSVVGTPIEEITRQHAKAAREAWTFLEAIQTSDYHDVLDLMPTFFNNSNVSPSDIPYISALGIHKVN